MANDLTMTSPSYGAGKFNTALTAGSGITNVIPTGTNWTFEFWFSTTASGGSNKVAWSIGTQGEIYVCIDPTGHMVCNLISAGSALTYNDGVYHHCALVGTASGVTLFVDGSSVASVATPRSLAASQPITIHRHQSFNGFDWVGSIDEFAIWTISKYSANFTPQTAAYSSGQANMLSLYHFDGDGTDSATLVAAPGTPTIGTATVSNGQVSTTFTPSGSGGTAASFTATFTPTSGSPTSAAGSGSPIVISGLPGNVTGTVHVTATNTGGTSAASAESNSVTTPAANTISITDTRVFWSPYNWDNRGAYKVTGCPGAYVKIGFTGTSIAVNVDVSVLVSSGLAAASYPRVRAIFDSVTAIDTQLTSSTTSVSSTGMSSGNHTLEFYLDATDDNSGDFWNTPTNNLSITGFSIDQGATANQWTPLGKNMLWYGDSISRGYKSLSISDTMPLGNSNAITISPSMAKAFGAEVGLVAYSGQGFEQQGGNTPGLLTSYDSYTSGRSRLVNGLLVPAPDYICSMHGTNGTTTQADVQSFLTKARAMAPNAIILMIVPASGAARSALTSGVSAQGDAKAFLVDVGTNYTAGINNYTSVQNYWSWDGLHYNALSNTRIGAATVRAAQAAIDGAVAPPLTARTVTFQLATGKNADNSLIYAANLTGAKIAFYDEASPDLHTVARYRTASGTFNSTGTCTFVAQSTLASGGTGSVVVWIGTNRYTSSVVVA